jgi:23S rRNA (uracil1939-C5)-methyltransferase
MRDTGRGVSVSTALLDVKLTAPSYGGDAIGRLDDGRAVFVPFGLPGERVRIRLTEERGHFARGVIVEVLEAAAERITPKCRHFGVCGGCHYQQAPYASQLRLKTEILKDQLTRIGHLEAPNVMPAVASPQPWHYRNQVQFHLTPVGRLGYMRAGSEEVLPIDECHLPAESINALWPQLQLEPDAGIERLGVRLGSDGEAMLVLHASSPNPPDLEVEAPVSIAHVYERDILVQAGEDHIRLQVLDREFRVGPTSFFQVNLDVAEKMVEHVLDALPGKLDTLIDAYCGVGLFSAFAAPRCTRLIGIEASATACEDFTANLDEFENVELYEDSVERVLPVLDARPEAVIVDPPRAGLERTVVDELVRLGPATIIYVSCDPATLARDCARLVKAGYALEKVTPFDMFPQTYHIESVGVLRRVPTP